LIRKINKKRYEDLKDELAEEDKKIFAEIKNACKKEKLKVDIQKILDNKSGKSEKWIGFKKEFNLEEKSIKKIIKDIITNERKNKEKDFELDNIEKLVEDEYENFKEETNRHSRENVTERHVEIYIKLSSGMFSKAKGTMASAFYSGSDTNQFDSGLNYNISADFLFDTSREKINSHA